MFLKFYFTLTLEHTNQTHKHSTRHLFSEQHNLKVFSPNLNIQGYTFFKVTVSIRNIQYINKFNKRTKEISSKENSLYPIRPLNGTLPLLITEERVSTQLLSYPFLRRAPGQIQRLRGPC